MKLGLRYATDRAWFSRLLRHLARKWSGSVINYNLGLGATRMGFLWRFFFR